MPVEKMSLINIAGPIDKLDDVILKCCESKAFHPEYANVGKTSGFSALSKENIYESRLQDIIGLMNILQIDPEYTDYSNLDTSLESIDEYIKKTKDKSSELIKKQHELENSIDINEQSLGYLKHISGFDVKFDDLRHSEHSTARFGRLPTDSFLKLQYFSDKTFFFFDLDKDDDYCWGVYVAPNANIAEIDDIFSSLYFEEIQIPENAHDTPVVASEHISKSIEKQKLKLEKCESKLEKLKSQDTKKIKQIHSFLTVKSQLDGYKKYAMVSQSQFYLEGFVPLTQSDNFTENVEKISGVICEKQPADINSRLTPPSKLKTNAFFKPFEMFVSMYGVPKYNELNPTTFIGLIYILLFGIMFGDLGQGFVLFLGGLLLYKLKGVKLAAVISRCGISSMIFGIAYGSVFGIEDMLDPMFKFFGFAEKPIDVFESSTTTTLLLCVIGLGIVITAVSIIINIFLKLRKKDYENALFSNNGIAGFVFYVGIIIGAVLMMMSGINILSPWFIIPIVIIPVLLMFLREPLGKLVKKKKDIKPKEGVAGFIMQNFFELFEFCLSFVTNTLSFLRVGGFVLSHAGMMAVVMTLADMVGNVGHIPVLILGNIFVMVLEGLLVGIQSLRLIFYETFSRFYDGDGKPFEPAVIDLNKIKK